MKLRFTAYDFCNHLPLFLSLSLAAQLCRCKTSCSKSQAKFESGEKRCEILVKRGRESAFLPPFSFVIIFVRTCSSSLVCSAEKKKQNEAEAQYVFSSLACERLLLKSKRNRARRAKPEPAQNVSSSSTFIGRTRATSAAFLHFLCFYCRCVRS